MYIIITKNAFNTVAYFCTYAFPNFLEEFFPFIPRMLEALLLSFSLKCLIYKMKHFQSRSFTLRHMGWDERKKRVLRRKAIYFASSILFSPTIIEDTCVQVRNFSSVLVILIFCQGNDCEVTSLAL